ncbi:MAG: EpsI family protein [Gallionellaceae bacterium]|nr:MAG: EpsI family protein [Gallionellaceae bacterium]
MKKPSITSLALGALMVAAAAMTVFMVPAATQAVQTARFNLETMIPEEFGDWKIDASSVGHIVNPTVKDALGKIYNQTLSRTYINGRGDRIMLSIAYGGAQKTDLHAHRPEICYASSGFDIRDKTKTVIDTAIGQIPVMRLVAKQGARNEPITYWIRVGDALTRGWVEQKVAAIGYGLTGKVPDGVLVRVSDISGNEQESYLLQQAFLDSMLQAVRSEERFWLVGQMAP